MLLNKHWISNMSQSVSNDSEIPLEFIDPITLGIMVSPVIIPSGHSYDRDSLEELFELICPLTRLPFTLDDMIPNRNLKGAIECHVKYLETKKSSLSEHDLELYMSYIEAREEFEQGELLYMYKVRCFDLGLLEGQQSHHE
jgi:hypothetical protein